MLVLVMLIREVAVPVLLGFVCVFVAVFAFRYGLVSVRVMPICMVVRMGMRFRRVKV